MAAQLLERAGFTRIRNLNVAVTNYPYADLIAGRDGRRYVVSVKIRNKYEARTNRLNSRYKLGSTCHELARKAEEREQATAAWLAISLDGDKLDAYFGLLEQLGGSRGIPMTPVAVSGYKCIAKQHPHGLDVAALKNVYAALVETHTGGESQGA